MTERKPDALHRSYRDWIAFVVSLTFLACAFFYVLGGTKADSSEPAVPAVLGLLIISFLCGPVCSMRHLSARETDKPRQRGPRIPEATIWLARISSYCQSGRRGHLMSSPRRLSDIDWACRRTEQTVQSPP